MKPWRIYFERNREQRRTIPWSDRLNLAPALAGPFIRSLQRFQLGESGDGRSLRTAAAATGDVDYAHAIELFVREEQEHARLMAGILKRLHAPLIREHWSNHAFVLLRRLFGLREHLMVLLIPETIAMRYFRTLREGLDDPMVRAVCEQILHDEEGHVAFHIDHLRRAFASLSVPGRAILRGLWRFVFRVSLLVMLFDHRSIVRACGQSGAAFWWDCELMFDDVLAQILACTQPGRRIAGPFSSELVDRSETETGRMPVLL